MPAIAPYFLMLSVFAAGERRVGLSVRLSGYGHQAGGRLVIRGDDAGIIGHQGVATRFLGPAADSKPAGAFGLRSYPVGRLLRQCASSKPLVPAQNGGARTTRAARFCRLGRRAGQRRRLF